MITIIHGDDVVQSREKLIELKNDFSGHEVMQLVGETTSITDIIQAFESRSLFTKKKLLILERFLETKDKKLVASVLNHLNQHLDHDVIFWEPKEIKQTLLSLFPKHATIHFFKHKQLIFRFLDSLRPGNARVTLLLLNQIRQRENPELVFYMLVRQFRVLLAITTNAGIDEIKRLAPWQRGKLERQARLFSKERLIEMYKRLFRIEKEVKTGSNPLSLSASLDLFLAEL